MNLNEKIKAMSIIVYFKPFNNGYILNQDQRSREHNNARSLASAQNYKISFFGYYSISLNPFYTKLICNLFISGLIQLLDLMHTLHTRALSIFKPPNVEGQRVPLNDSSMQPIVGEVCLTYYFAVV